MYNFIFLELVGTQGNSCLGDGVKVIELSLYSNFGVEPDSSFFNDPLRF